MVKILVFDTETTDKPPMTAGSSWQERQEKEKLLLNLNNFDESWSKVIDKWPYIIQLSYILYDTNEPSNVLIFNKYIDLPDDISISVESISIHHITRETIRDTPPENKSTIQQALKDFMLAFKNADVVVAHNVQFDRKMIVAELLRLSKEETLPQIIEMMDESKFECTMEKTTSLCKIKQQINYTDKITGEQKSFFKIKSPKLSEAYEHFFGYAPTGESLHDALVDVVICLRIYLKYNNFEDVCGKNDAITNLIIDFSPPNYKCPISDSNIEIPIKGGKRRSNKTKRRNKKRQRKNKKTKRNKQTRK